jgi:hypothetical protein
MLLPEHAQADQLGRLKSLLFTVRRGFPPGTAQGLVDVHWSTYRLQIAIFFGVLTGTPHGGWRIELRTLPPAERAGDAQVEVLVQPPSGLDAEQQQALDDLRRQCGLR